MTPLDLREKDQQTVKKFVRNEQCLLLVNCTDNTYGKMVTKNERS